MNVHHVNIVAQAIRVANGDHTMGAAALAEVAVATLAPLVTTEIVAAIHASEGWHEDDWGVECIYRDAVDRAVAAFITTTTEMS